VLLPGRLVAWFPASLELLAGAGFP